MAVANFSVTRDYIQGNFMEEKYAIIILYVPVFFSAFIANCLVIIVVIRDQNMRSVTNYFLVNLSIADLMVTLISMPEAIAKAYKFNYDLGRYFCKLSAYLQGIAVSSSIFTITAMTLDRYLGIAKPLSFFHSCFNKRTTILVIICLWSVSITLLFPMFIISDLSSNPIIGLSSDNNGTFSIDICHEDWDKFSLISREKMGLIWFTCMFAIPGAIITYGYTMMGRTLCSATPPFNEDGASYMQQRNKVVRRIRGRKRVACILLILAFVFAICWLPYHTMLLLLDMSKAEINRVKDLNAYFLLLGHLNSALNPIIYCALSKRFRNSIKNLFDLKAQFSRRRTPNQWGDSSGFGTPMNNTPRHSHHYPLTKLNSSQKTVNTCAV